MDTDIKYRNRGFAIGIYAGFFMCVISILFFIDFFESFFKYEKWGIFSVLVFLTATSLIGYFIGFIIDKIKNK
jgi:hypothetical protein